MYTKIVNDGYYRKPVTYDERLKYCPYGSAGVMFGADGSISLYSYTTRIITIDNDGWMDCTGTYSATTRKHIGAFLKEYGNGFGYQTAKELAKTGNKINIDTGRIKEE